MIQSNRGTFALPAGHRRRQKSSFMSSTFRRCTSVSTRPLEFPSQTTSWDGRIQTGDKQSIVGHPSHQHFVASIFRGDGYVYAGYDVRPRRAFQAPSGDRPSGHQCDDSRFPVWVPCKMSPIIHSATAPRRGASCLLDRLRSIAFPNRERESEVVAD